MVAAAKEEVLAIVQPPTAVIACDAAKVGVPTQQSGATNLSPPRARRVMNALLSDCDQQVRSLARGVLWYADSKSRQGQEYESIPTDRAQRSP